MSDTGEGFLVGGGVVGCPGSHDLTATRNADGPIGPSIGSISRSDDESGPHNYGTAEEAYLDLKSGRLDYVLADHASLVDGLISKEDGANYELVGPGLTDARWFGEGAGIAVRKSDGDLKAMFNQAIQDIRANGKYKEVNDKYFDFDAYGE